MRFNESSSAYVQYSDFLIPFSYAAWNTLSWFRAATPIPSCVIGCKVVGSLEPTNKNHMLSISGECGERGKLVRVDELHDVLGEFSLLCELAGELARLCFCGDLAGEKKPEHALGDDLFAAWRGGQLFLAVWDGQAVESNTLKV